MMICVRAISHTDEGAEGAEARSSKGEAIAKKTSFPGFLTYRIVSS